MKLGILGSGKIVPVFLDAMQEGLHETAYAICGREESAAKLKKLQETHGIEKVYTDRAAFLSDEALDAVYVALPNDMHYLAAKEALLAGKHVILEKPFTTTRAEGEELFHIADEKGLVLYENVSTTSNPNLELVQRWLPLIGPVRLVTADYSQYSSRYTDFINGIIHPALDIRHKGGALRDLGVYPLQLVASLFGAPKSLTAKAHFQRGVDTSAAVILDYGEMIACVTASKETDGRSGFMIQGEKGRIRCDTAPNYMEKVELLLEDRTEEKDLRRFQNRLAEGIVLFEEAVEKKQLLPDAFRKNTEIVLDMVDEAVSILY